MSDSFSTASKIEAQQAAYAAAQKLTIEPTAVINYQSRGHVIILGNPDLIEKIGELPESLTHEAIVYQGLSPAADIQIEGALGRFKVTVNGQAVAGDLIVDGLPQPVLHMALKPPGYITVNQETLHAAELKQELMHLVGTFEKPRYFDYNEAICAHGRSGISGCTRCLDACPAEAISSLVDKIKVDPYRCQGGGICSTVCPSGAITYAYPRPRDLLAHVRTLLMTYRQVMDEAPELLFVTELEQNRVKHLMPAALIIAVEEIASVGPEVWMSALAWGARNVRLFSLDGLPDSTQSALSIQLETAQTALSGMGFPPSAITQISDPNELITAQSMPVIKPSQHAVLSQKRQAFFMALDYLVAQAEEVTPIMSLPEGAIFGEVNVDQTRCTLCMACVSACPGNALQDGRENPRLSFIEANCVQCDICTRTCPENAITTAPRLLLDNALRQQAQVLHEDTPFCCISCGKPFATTSGIATIITKLAGHSMFAEERARNRLKMCDDCRVKDMMEDPSVDF